MAWTIEYADAARKQLRKLDRATAQRIYRYLSERVAPLDDPRGLGKALSGPLGELWRYRVGDYRVIAELRHDTLTVLVLRTGHGRDIYEQQP
ncbi:MAG: type II toxin-antitoxin system RelE/ParE family toxin [Burkholderiaceae bacterium]|nr:MAG: type II toxin-antitoxin system RelE/ParE family toxin [Burkholderiaceae bacterium]